MALHAFLTSSSGAICKTPCAHRTIALVSPFCLSNSFRHPKVRSTAQVVVEKSSDGISSVCSKNLASIAVNLSITAWMTIGYSSFTVDCCLSNAVSVTPASVTLVSTTSFCLLTILLLLGSSISVGCVPSLSVSSSVCFIV